VWFIRNLALGVVSVGIIFTVYLHVYTFFCIVFILLPPFPYPFPLSLVPAFRLRRWIHLLHRLFTQVLTLYQIQSITTIKGKKRLVQRLKKERNLVLGSYRHVVLGKIYSYSSDIFIEILMILNFMSHISSLDFGSGIML
jgi:hypothetical protein